MKEADHHMTSKHLDNRGVSRIIVIMLIAVIALSIPIIWGIATSIRASAEERECNIAIDSAQRKLDDEFLLNPSMTEEQAENAATSEIRSLEGTCPSGGKYYIKKKKDGNGYEIYCDYHEKE